MASARRWLRVGPGLECQPALFIAQRMKVFVRCSLFFSIAANLAAADLPASARQFVERHCFECHDAETQKGGLNLAALQFDLANPTNFSRWVTVHDRVSRGEMPPKKKARPESAELASFTEALSSALVSAEQDRLAKEGRATWRR